jgi:hypothetical protein
MRSIVASACTALALLTVAGCVTRVVERQEAAPPPAATVVTTTPGQTVIVTAPAVATQPYCGGVYSPTGGTNFGGCPGTTAPK